MPQVVGGLRRVIVVVVWLFGLEFLSQAKAVLHLMLGVLVERARAVEDLLVLLIVVALGSWFSSDDVVWLAAAILTRLGTFLPIIATIQMVTVVIVATVVVAPVVGAIIAAASWVMSACILVKA